MTRRDLLLSAAAAAAVVFAIWTLGRSVDPAPPLTLPVTSIDGPMAARLAEQRTARAAGMVLGEAEQPVVAAWKAYNLREAETGRLKPPDGRSRSDLIDADPEVGKRSRWLQAAIGTYVRASGKERYAALGSLLAEEFDRGLANLLIDGVPGGADPAADVAAALADPARAEALGAFPLLFIERGLLRPGKALGPSERAYAGALFAWRWAVLAGPTGPDELLEPLERLAYWRAVVEIDAPGDPTARLTRRLAALDEIAKLDPTYPVAWTRDALAVRAAPPR